MPFVINFILKEADSMNLENFTIKAQEALQEASSIANKNDCSEICTEHLLQALLEQKDGLIVPIVERIGAPVKELLLMQFHQNQKHTVILRFIYLLKCRK